MRQSVDRRPNFAVGQRASRQVRGACAGAFIGPSGAMNTTRIGASGAHVVDRAQAGRERQQEQLGMNV